ncbi:MAG: zincin-like metallopeptidase domain-containing protein [Synechococcaceae cyanobacterium]|nr:zincin-like metallopeptidase domain-containing protein [Synechococcaceae cyanobacterium]
MDRPRQLALDLPVLGLALPSDGAMAVIAPQPAEPLPDRRLAAEQRLLASVLEVLEAGTTPWRREWDGSGGGHHRNLVNGHRYRGVNPILLTLALQARQIHAVGSSELSGLPYWCGFAAARSLGLHPRAGSRAIQILRPQRLQRRGAAPAQASAASPSGAPRCGEAPASPLGAPWAAAPAEVTAASHDAPARPGSWIRYRPVAVFHVSDLVGEGLEALVARRHDASKASLRPESERLEQAELALNRWPVPLELGGAMACYLPTLDRIQLPLRNAFHSAAAFYATWAHEAVHSTGHASRLNRDLSGRMGGDAVSERTYAREELVAELGAMLIGDRLEIGSDTANHAAYMSHWIALLQDSPRLLYQVLGEARRAADLVVPDTDEPASGCDAEA